MEQKKLIRQGGIDCPYCEHSHREYWKYVKSFDEIGKLEEFVCELCGETFDIVIIFKTKKK